MISMSWKNVRSVCPNLPCLVAKITYFDKQDRGKFYAVFSACLLQKSMEAEKMSMGPMLLTMQEMINSSCGNLKG